MRNSATTPHDLHPPLHLFVKKKELLDAVTRQEYHSRLDAWLSFFEEFEHHPFFFYQATVKTLHEAFRYSDIIRKQTQVQFELSKAFYVEILRVREPRILSEQGAAAKLLQLSLIFGKYPGMFRYSFIQHFKESPESLSSEGINELFMHCLVKYEIPHYVVQNFEYLSEMDLEILMLALHGKNLHKHSVFQHKCSRKEFSELMQLDAPEIKFTDKVLLRGLIFLKIQKGLLQNDPDPDFLDDQNGRVYTFLRSSPTFLNSPERYLEDIEYWQRAASMVADIVVDFQNNLNITDCVDFLEYMKYRSDRPYSLQGRTVRSLNRAIHEWHQRIYTDHNSTYLDAEWTAQADELDLHFTYLEEDYACLQILSGKALDEEGKKMKHCVMTYAPSCIKRHCSIWSLRSKKKNKFKPLLTLEVIDKTVVQARGVSNKLPEPMEMVIVYEWAKRIGYEVDLYKNL